MQPGKSKNGCLVQGQILVISTNFDFPSSANPLIKSMLKTLKLFLKNNPKKLILFILFFILWLFCLPARLFDVGYSTVVEDRNGKLLNAIVADDGQWRFPASDAIPEK
ncbi:MAG: hypothetical protein H0X62_01130 [Bacteroidetes bacterium]|nr:hypothetical protein [Bacteroidota bacterium]